MVMYAKMAAVLSSEVAETGGAGGAGGVGTVSILLLRVDRAGTGRG